MVRESQGKRVLFRIVRESQGTSEKSGKHAMIRGELHFHILGQGKFHFLSSWK